MGDFMASWYRQREREELAREIDPLGLLTTDEVGEVVDFVEQGRCVVAHTNDAHLRRRYFQAALDGTDETAIHARLTAAGADYVFGEDTIAGIWHGYWLAPAWRIDAIARELAARDPAIATLTCATWPSYGRRHPHGIPEEVATASADELAYRCGYADGYAAGLLVGARPLDPRGPGPLGGRTEAVNDAAYDEDAEDRRAR